MGVYIYTVPRRQFVKLADGRKLYWSRFAYRCGLSAKDDERFWNQRCRPTIRTWGDALSDERTNVLFVESHKPVGGEMVYEYTGPAFNGTYADTMCSPSIRHVGYVVRRADGLHVVAAAELNALWQRNSVFKSTSDALAASPNYRPSLDVSDPDMLLLADAYDSFAVAQKDPRRAYRYGQS